MNNRKFRWLLGLYIIAIFSLSAIPGESLPTQLFPQWDKVVHFIEYFFFGLLACNSIDKPNPRMIFFLIIGGIVVSGMDETWQSFQPGRDSSVFDMFADGLGFIFGSIFALKWFKIQSVK
ncbi:MAG: VanZ family protein [Candidatus Marinimicrobia bacterium]|jgi:VanZ family protein|nr:VanZ family protein [Candidatus Neomarinimicrobiota bacterium]MBT3618583.1 VanZ family protein [Candidatus Neomarinimicrobiota bacterium]MBT3828810.1 VanZ family protein [Candidatus Neomarinimicrobiota bacterium]MBT3996828.1 VanZ family protein [Candidatus Neomarinimicrobiota bacterium]MBT4281021.1 VanZ family protein [Candidatus Neomarinimicrobiota bacterium]